MSVISTFLLPIRKDADAEADADADADEHTELMVNIKLYFLFVSHGKC